MNKYEITIITKENLKEAPVKKEIVGFGGKILAVNSLGQKQLIYPIKKETAGYYTVVNFEIEKDKVIELNQKLGLLPEIMRHLILTAKTAKIALPKIKKEEVKVEEKTEEVPAIAKKVKKVAEKHVPAPAAPTVTKAAKEIREEELSTEERLKALDKKLDELLKE